MLEKYGARYCGYVLYACLLALTACGGGGGGGGNSSSSSNTTPVYAIRGTASGLSGSGLVLQNSGGDNLAISASGSFRFATSLASGSGYNVTVSAQPSSPSQTCVVTNANGTVASADITNVLVNCSTNNYLVSGTVTGLTGTGLALQLNGGSALSINGVNRNFTFPTGVTSGDIYNVTVATQPTAPSQTCTPTNGSGTIGGGNVANVIINCVTNVSSTSYTVGGNVNGLVGTVELQLNGSTNLSVSGSSFLFSASLADGAPYSVTVRTQPATQTCTVAGSTGIVAGANVANVIVTCAANVDLRYVGGSISGLTGTGLQLQLNGTNDLFVPTSSSAFQFPGKIAAGSLYSVTVSRQPLSPSQQCVVANGSGMIGASDIANVQVNCSTNTYPVSVTVHGLSGSGLVLQNNGADNLSTNTNGSFTFANSVASGTAYHVTVATAPSGPTQTCTVTNGLGTIANGGVTDVVVNCAINAYTVSGAVTGLTGTVVLRLNGGNDLSVSANGGFGFSSIADGSAYNVTVATQPTSPRQTCVVTAGSGTLAGTSVSNVVVSCSVVKWAGVKQFGSPLDDVANAVAVDPSNGDVVVVGCYRGALSGNYKGTCDMPGGNAQSYVRKYDRTGDLQWETSLGNSGNTQGNGVAIDASGYIYVTGTSQGAFDGQSGFNDDDIFLTKYKGNGDKLWTGIYGGVSADRGYAVAFDPTGNLYLAGSIYTTSQDIFIAKFAKAGVDSLTTAPTALLTAEFGSTQAGSAQPNDLAYHVATDSAGNVYVAGTTLGNLNGNTNGSGTGNPDTFVMKLDPATLAEVWTRQIGTSSYDRNGGLVVDASDGIYVAGSTGGSLPGFTNPAPGVNDLFVVKYDTSGSEQWKRQIVSPGHDYVTGVASGPGSNVYIVGYSTSDFNGGRNTDRSGNTMDAFVVKYDVSGTQLWSRETGTMTDDRPYATAVDSDGGVFIVGYTLGGIGGNSNAGGADMFVMKYDAAGERQ